VMATGGIDSFDFVRLPLHKKKIIKMSLLYERLSVIIVSFAYATDKLAECHRYLANLIRFSLSNYLICLKVISAGCVKQSSPLYQQHQDIWLLSAKEYQTKGLETLRDNNEILADTINKLAREDEIFFDSLKKFIKNSGKFTLQQNFYYILEYFALFLNLCELDHRIPFLAVAPNPYLPPTTTPEKYTLVIDLLQVMCHPKKTESFRPYSQYFFDEMSQYYEIVVFSAAYPNHLNKVIDIVDRKKRVQHRLYRHHTIRSLGAFVKDVSRLGR
jgi:CTD small phosphatase-like protein 2